jgi:hypothetical protein
MAANRITLGSTSTTSVASPSILLFNKPGAVMATSRIVRVSRQGRFCIVCIWRSVTTLRSPVYAVDGSHVEYQLMWRRETHQCRFSILRRVVTLRPDTDPAATHGRYAMSGMLRWLWTSTPIISGFPRRASCLDHGARTFRETLMNCVWRQYFARCIYQYRSDRLSRFLTIPTAFSCVAISTIVPHPASVLRSRGADRDGRLRNWILFFELSAELPN